MVDQNEWEEFWRGEPVVFVDVTYQRRTGRTPVEDVYVQEVERSLEVLNQNRHNSHTGEWYGPDPEPQPSSKDCRCGGCFVRFSIWTP